MRTLPVSAILLLAVCLPATVEAQPVRSAKSVQAQATVLSTNYMNHVACLAERIGQSIETVAEMTWVEAAQADAGFRHRHRVSVGAILNIKANENRWPAQRAAALRLKRLAPELRELTCARSTAHFRAAVRFGERWWNPRPGEPEPEV